MSKKKSSNINTIKRRKFLVIRISEENIVIRLYINYSESKTPKQFRVFKSLGICNHYLSTNRNNYDLVITESD